MPTDLTQAIIEAYSLAPTNVAILETIEIYNPLMSPDSIYLVKDRIGYLMNIEGGIPKAFEPAPFRITLPSKSDGGLQELTISIDNIDRRVGEFMKNSRNLESPTLIKYRPYLSTDLTTPQISPPLTLYLKDSTMTVFEVTIRASFLNFLNKKFPSPSQYYSRSRFIGLGR